MEVLKFTTAGSVDDGKSTLIGRLLLDSKVVMEDQLGAIREAGRRRGDEELNLALLTDGLKAEREQGITIDVAYRYFTTPRRKFIIADCPGHIQYTRNMVTGSSTANLAVVLVDVRKGLLEQTRRHCFIASLLRIPHLVICVNKMDLVDYSRNAFEDVREQFQEFSRKLEIHDVAFIPISALHGDNVVGRSAKTPWYKGQSLLTHLEEVHIASDFNHIDLRFPVQHVIGPRPGAAQDRRGYGGMLASGSLRKGDEVVALPSGFSSQVESLELGGREMPEASAPLCVTVRLQHEIDLSRGDVLARPNNQPAVCQDIDAMICWMDREPMRRDKKYVIRHMTKEVLGQVQEIVYKLDINTLSRVFEDKEVGLNDFARVKLRASRPLCYDSYRINRVTGSFVIIDPQSCSTVAAGLII